MKLAVTYILSGTIASKGLTDIDVGAHLGGFLRDVAGLRSDDACRTVRRAWSTATSSWVACADRRQVLLRRLQVGLRRGGGGTTMLQTWSVSPLLGQLLVSAQVLLLLGPLGPPRLDIGGGSFRLGPFACTAASAAATRS